MAIFANLSFGHVMIKLSNIQLKNKRNVQQEINHLKKNPIETRTHLLNPIHSKAGKKYLAARPVTINLKELNRIENEKHLNKKAIYHKIKNAVTKNVVDRAVTVHMKKINEKENENKDKTTTKKHKMVPIYPNFDGVDNNLAASVVASSSNQ